MTTTLAGSAPPDNELALSATESGGDRTGPAVEIVLPVHNEEVDLEPGVRRLADHLAAQFPFSYGITIADNASTDGTWARARLLADTVPHVRVVRLSEKGRGRALGATWAVSEAEVVAYMDIDLSTDLAALLPLVAPLLTGHSDVAIGSRLARTSRVVRGARREVLSRGYNLLLRTTLRARFSDAQCGFKAMRADCARRLLPLVQDTGWFFDTELLLLAERAGLRIHEVPVDWVDDPDSRVQLTRTVLADLRGIGRMLRALGTGALPVAELRRQFGRGRLAARHAARSQIEGLVVFGLGLLLTSGALAALHLAVHRPSRLAELAVLVAANVVATVLRFLAYRSWVFAARRHPFDQQSGPATRAG